MLLMNVCACCRTSSMLLFAFFSWFSCADLTLVADIFICAAIAAVKVLKYSWSDFKCACAAEEDLVEVYDALRILIVVLRCFSFWPDCDFFWCKVCFVGLIMQICVFAWNSLLLLTSPPSTLSGLSQVREGDGQSRAGRGRAGRAVPVNDASAEGSIPRTSISWRFFSHKGGSSPHKQTHPLSNERSIFKDEAWAVFAPF